MTLQYGFQSIPISLTPNFGEPSSEKTEIRLAYTDRNLYVSVVGFDSDPSKIVVSDSKRDADLNDEDSFLFILDTYNDFQNGFLFGTNSDAVSYTHLTLPTTPYV